MSTQDGKNVNSGKSLLSEELAGHYTAHGIDVQQLEDYITTTANKSDKAAMTGQELNNEPNTDNKQWGSRFIRLNPRFDTKESLKLLTSELPPNTTPPRPVPWLQLRNKDDENNSELDTFFYAIPATFRLNQSHVFQSGRVYGMDVSSGAAIAALLFDIYDVLDRGTTKKPDSSLLPTRVLDLCAAPGLKTCTIADMLMIQQQSHQDTQRSPISTNNTSSHDNITIIGVDISQQRMNNCKKIINKYHVHPDTCGEEIKKNMRPVEIRLYCADGTTFGTKPAESSSALIFDASAARQEYSINASSKSNKRKRMNKSARAREKKRLRLLSQMDPIINSSQQQQTENDNSKTLCSQEKQSISYTEIYVEPFDRVLVDAECSTDGAIRHIQQDYQMNESKHDLEQESTKPKVKHMNSCPKLSDKDQLQSLVQLQKLLIENGFRLTKPGGVLVYSTCSLSKEQNEDVCQSLLDKYPSAYLIQLRIPKSVEKHPQENSGDDHGTSHQMITDGYLNGTLRFKPNLYCSSKPDDNELFGGGFFIAKIGKRCT